MLRELSVQNMAVIEDVRVELHEGFCAWTGETGAGKTLLLAALGLLLGERGSADLIRAGADELRIAGRFELAKPGLRPAAETILQGPVEDEQLILLRRLHRAGRSSAYVNDQPVTVATLRQLGELLVDIHGQRESQFLLQPAYQLRALDALGDLDAHADAYRKHASRVRELRRRLATLDADRQKRLRELALVRFERDELDQANLRPGEVAALARERERLAHAQALQDFRRRRVRSAVRRGRLAVRGDRQIAARRGSLVALDPALGEIAQRLGGIASEAQDICRDAAPLADRLQADPARRDEVETRLQLLATVGDEIRQTDRRADRVPAIARCAGTGARQRRRRIATRSIASCAPRWSELRHGRCGAEPAAAEGGPPFRRRLCRRS